MVILLLGLGTMFFSSRVSGMVIGPIEAMIKKVKGIATDPLAAAQNEEEQVLLKEIEERELYGNEKYQDMKRK
jgi:hypothetical protein